MTVIFESLGPYHDQGAQQFQQSQPPRSFSFAPPERLPKAPKTGYNITPNFVALSRMSLHELQNVENFTIENEHGKIQFIGKTDLTDVDLAATVSIMRQEAEVYNDNDPNVIKPPVGQKLNKPAIITLKGIGNQNKTEAQNITLFKKAFDHPGDSEFLRYDAATGDALFKVFHFTKYRFEDDDSEQQPYDDAQSEQFESERSDMMQQQISHKP